MTHALAMTRDDGEGRFQLTHTLYVSPAEEYFEGRGRRSGVSVNELAAIADVVGQDELTEAVR